MNAGTDQTMARIAAAIELGRTGARPAARDALLQVWEEVGPHGDPFHRCVIGHYLADLQDDLRDELIWDLRALEAAGSLTDAGVQKYESSLQVQGFLPSLHLNLADDYRRLSEPEQARAHLAQARVSLAALPDDGYGSMIRAGLDHVEQALSEGSTAPLPTHHA